MDKGCMLMVDYNFPNTFDIHLFHEGTSYESYKFLGAHLMNKKGVKGVNFTLWAPDALSVSVLGDFNKWKLDEYKCKKIPNSGLFNIFIPNIKEGDIYKYQIKTKDGKDILKSDPYGFSQELRPNTASIVTDINKYNFNDESWMEKRKKFNIDNPINIYEVHIGSWKEKGKNFLKFSDVACELIDYVKEMGYTHIELLPLTEHPYDGSWGYQSTGYFCPTSRYGKPEEFKYFIDKCHQNDLGVILDWVPGHFCKDIHGLYNFDGSNLYEYDNPLKAENYEWGTANFDHGKKEVKSFLISSAAYWFNIFHIDGLRVDAVSHMLYLDYLKEDNEWVANKFGGNKNLDSINFLRNLNETIKRVFPDVLMIAEESTAYPLVTTPKEIGGLGFDFKWNMGWMNDILKYMSLSPNKRKENENLITFSFTYAFNENFILPLSHDEVVHGKKSLIEKMPGSYDEKFSNLRLLFSYMIAHPGKKLLFMGGEFAQFIEWDYKKGLDWLLLQYKSHYRFSNMVKVLNNLYLRESSLYKLDNSLKGFKWIDHNKSVFIFIRKDLKENFLILVFNFGYEEFKNYKIGVPEYGLYREIFNSDDKAFGGTGYVNNHLIKSDKKSWHDMPYLINIKIPSLSSCFIKLDKGDSHDKKKKGNDSDASCRRARI
ncbi:MAG: 1,4-alpha-glucan branching protein GlgB [Firmicutes bacterium]|nr:1,4-alpha-glucan branching protein GlgB [Bacillota bacterium]